MSSSESGRFGVVLFHSVQGAIGAEKRLLAAGLAHKLISVPRHLKSDCGFCLRFAWPDREAVERELANGDLGVQAIVGLQG